MGATPSLNYQAIAPWADNNPHPTGFTAKYPGPYAGINRTLFPIRLGYDRKDPPPPGSPPVPPLDDSNEVVLCWQVADPGSNPPLPEGWRCFRVAKLTNIAASGAGWPNPPHDGQDHPNQGCVQHVKHHP